MKRFQRLLLTATPLAVLLWTLGQGCSPSFQAGFRGLPDQSKMPVFLGTSTGNPPSEKLSFQTVSSVVFKNNCVQCHGPSRAEKGVRYDNYQSAIHSGQLAALHASYLEQHEPSKSCQAVPASSMALVRAWIESGAPE